MVFIVALVAGTVAVRLLIVPKRIFALASTEGGTRLVWR